MIEIFVEIQTNAFEAEFPAAGGALRRPLLEIVRPHAVKAVVGEEGLTRDDGKLVPFQLIGAFPFIGGGSGEEDRMTPRMPRV